MTPELEQALARIDTLEREVQLLIEFIENKKVQQFNYPLDETSRNIINNTI